MEDIQDSAEKILEYTRGMSFDMFSKDNKTVDAVVRNFEIIGEASNLLPDEIKDNYPVFLTSPPSSPGSLITGPKACGS